MKQTLSKIALIAALIVPATSFAQTHEGQRLALLAFDSIDTNERGYIDQGDFAEFGSNVFTSMDYDDDNRLTLKEYLSWDFGMRPLAEELGREHAYETALRVVFAFWDRNGDNVISQTEHRQSLNFDFQRADIDNNAVLSKTEFTSGFSVMVALRAAINPAPVE